MYCMKCGQHMPDDSQFCPHCGEVLHGENPAPAEKDSSHLLGLISMILGFVAVGTQVVGINTVVSMPAAIAALVCGFLAKNRAAELGLDHSKAKTGIICAFVGIGVSIVNSLLVLAVFVIYFAFFFIIMSAARM